MENFGELWKTLEILASFFLIWEVCFSLYSFSPLKMEETPNHRETNPQETDSQLTVEKVKQCKGYQHITDEEALQVIQSITALCQIASKTATLSGKL